MEHNEENDSSSDSTIILEITLISAQSLKPPANLLRRLHAYATLLPPSSSSTPHVPHVLLRTRTDPLGSTNPTWNDKFLLRLPPSALSPSSSSSISVHILADAGFLRPDPLVGSVRLLLSNHRLLSRPSDLPTFAALGIRRPSGRFHGVLNVAFTLLSKVPNLVHLALSAGPAVGYRDLMTLGGPLKELNITINNKDDNNINIKKKKKDKKGKEKEAKGGGGEDKENLCGLGLGLGLGFGRGLRHLQSQSCRIHVSPSDQILNLQQIPWLLKDRNLTAGEGGEEEEVEESNDGESGEIEFEEPEPCI